MVVDAFRLPKGSDDEKQARSAAIQAALTAATEAPLEVMRRCAEALKLAPLVKAFGNPNASSDIEVGTAMLQTGLRGARANVEINLSSLKDASYVERVRMEASELAATAS